MRFTHFSPKKVSLRYKKRKDAAGLCILCRKNAYFLQSSLSTHTYFPTWTCPDTQRIYALSKVHILSSSTHTYQAYWWFGKYGYVLKSMVTKRPATFYGALVLFKWYKSVSKPLFTKRSSTSHGAYILSKW